MLLYLIPSLWATTLSLSFLACIVISNASPLMNKTEFINWFDTITADSPYNNGESIAKHLHARATLERVLDFPVELGTGEEALSNVFTIQPASVPGGCSSAEAALLDNAWTAAYILLPYAQAAVNNYETDVIARYIFQRLYGISWGNQQADGTWPPANQDMMNDLQTLEVIGEEIRDFMEGQGLPKSIKGRDLYPGVDQSFMFCSLEWKQFHNWGDQAFDSSGDLMKGAGGEPIEISQLVTIGKYATQLFTNTLGEKVQLYPYWSQLHLGYFLGPLYPGNPPSFCNGPGNLGQTNDFSLPFALSLCDAAFQYGNPPAIAQSTPFSSVYPTTAAVMLHELFHFTQGIGNSPDTCYGPTDCMNMISTLGPGIGREKAVDNPDTFALLAVAYMYSVEDFDGISGQGNSHLYYDISQGFARSFRVTS